MRAGSDRQTGSKMFLHSLGRFQPFASGISAQICAYSWLLRVVFESFAKIGGLEVHFRIDADKQFIAQLQDVQNVLRDGRLT